jgi:hypothetical protein
MVLIAALSSWHFWAEEPSCGRKSSPTCSHGRRLAQLPNGRAMGAVGKAAIDRDGLYAWAVIR